MRTLALRKIPARPGPEYARPTLEYATVEEAHEGALALRTPHGPATARLAASCLLAPEPGDRVLVSLDREEAFVLAVLERSGAGERRLVLPGPARLEVPEGRLSIAARDGVSLASATEVSLAAPDLAMSAARLTAGVTETAFTGAGLEARVARIKVVARAVDSFLGRCVERMVSCLRQVREHDETQAGSARQIVEGTLTVHTANTVHLAEGHVKIDAEQIHLG